MRVLRIGPTLLPQSTPEEAELALAHRLSWGMGSPQRLSLSGEDNGGISAGWQANDVVLGLAK